MENNAVDGCSIYNNSWYGINVAAYGQAQPCDVGYTHILNSEIYDNGRVPEGGSVQAGIRIFYTEHNIVENCSIHGNGDGVDVVGSDNMIRNCSIFNQWQPPASVNSEDVNIWGDFFKLKVNDTLEHCDIYDNDIGVSLGEWVRQTYIHHNVIYNNSILGLISMFMVGGGNKVRMNNFEGNGHGWIPLKNHSSHYVMYAISDVRDNWWGSPRGPSLYLVTHKGNKLNQIRLIPNADSIIIFRGICRFWPWLKEPVQNAGRIT
jgi:parallel beta-helix repeat protein